MVKRPYRAASGAVHLMGNLAPVCDGEDSGEVTPLEGPGFQEMALMSHSDTDTIIIVYSGSNRFENGS